MSSGNGNGQVPVEVLPPGLPPPYFLSDPVPTRRQPPRLRWLLVSVALFVMTVFSTLAVGAIFARAYAAGHIPTFEEFFNSYFTVLTTPRMLLAGIPFSFTLIGILLAHELGHYFTCRYYSISASYPYFLPAPTLIGTLGAFIRIRSPIINRKALFDVGLSGPVVGFMLALPALAVAIAYSKVVPGAQSGSEVIFGDPLLSRLLMAWLRPGVAHADILLHPVGRAAWVGLFATAINLLPAGQLDGGHILYALRSDFHRRVTFVVAFVMALLGHFAWWGWYPWAAILLLIGFRHPPLLDRFEPLDHSRRLWAVVGLIIFALCFTPWPLNNP